MEKRRLGKGLEALLGVSVEEAAADVPPSQLPVDLIETNPFQPRRDFDPAEMDALKRSLQTHGLLQPIVVRPSNGGYQVIAGERRLRAAKDAGWKEIPVRIVDFNDQQTFEAALVENLQRTDLNPIEKAQGFRDYLQQYGLTQEELAKRVGLDRATISNFMRLLELPPEVQDAVRAGQISNGHARALLGLDDPERQKSLCREIIRNGLSVRAVEQMVKAERSRATAPNASPAKEMPTKTHHVQAIEDELRRKFMTKIEIRLTGKDKGQFVIEFGSNDDFERILEHLRR
ncbi:MAG: ParB/RepB/Spo0J family partition protein [Gemmatales bacterium]|nr:ParB/RepB/Spo0J family partition protein [Gemmatales bacterium]MDW8387103.1 ParB/RepB/Spo0J family partition protein [Gemmatales bacterium]